MPKSVRDSGDSDEKVDPFQVVVEALLVREDTTGRFQHGHWRGEQGRKLKTEYGEMQFGGGGFISQKIPAKGLSCLHLQTVMEVEVGTQVFGKDSEAGTSETCVALGKGEKTGCPGRG